MDRVADVMPRLIDGRVVDVAAVVWATGFRPDYSWIEVPGLSLDVDGYPIHDRGVVDGVPGLYFVGLSYQPTLISATIGGVCTDARYIADSLRTETNAGNPNDIKTKFEQGTLCPTDLRHLLKLW